MGRHHGMYPLRGQQQFCRAGHEPRRSDRFGRMFPALPAAYVPPPVLARVGAKGGPMDGGAGSAATRTDSVPVGHVFFGQFIDHDITLDTTSSFGRVNEPGEIPNRRTPQLDLDCVYGAGPEATPFLYHPAGDFAGTKLLVGADEPGADALAVEDLLRAPIPGGGRGTAIIGDPRNDENRIISQLQLGMIRLHNRFCDELAGHEDVFEEARRETTWHYQWAVVYDFLTAMCGAAVVEEVLTDGRRFYCGAEPYIPVEFSVAAYRFGHSMAPMKINVQDGGGSFELFGQKLGRGFSALSDPAAVVHWTELFFGPGQGQVQRAEKLDTTMASDLLALPFVAAPDERSLATRNLLRGNAFLLPGGDRIARHMERPDGEISQVMDRIGEMAPEITRGAPLWLYLLAEAEVIGRETEAGRFEPGEGLGPVGARIVAETMIGLLELDEHSFLGANRSWSPAEDADTIGKLLIANGAPA